MHNVRHEPLADSQVGSKPAMAATLVGENHLQPGGPVVLIPAHRMIISCSQEQVNYCLQSELGDCRQAGFDLMTEQDVLSRREAEREQRRIFAAWLKRILAQREMTQTELARKAGLSPSRINDYAREISLPSPANAHRIADALNVDPELVLEQAGILKPDALGPESPDDPFAEKLEEMEGLIRRIEWNEDLAEQVLGLLRTIRRQQTRGRSRG